MKICDSNCLFTKRCRYGSNCIKVKRIGMIAVRLLAVGCNCEGACLLVHMLIKLQKILRRGYAE
jgi:hypothetical protein